MDKKMDKETKNIQNTILKFLESTQEICKEIENLRPFVRLVLNAIESFGPEFATIPDMTVDWIVARKVKTIEQYRKAGFSKKEAILLTIDGKVALQNSLSNLQKVK